MSEHSIGQNEIFNRVYKGPNKTGDNVDGLSLLNYAWNPATSQWERATMQTTVVTGGLVPKGAYDNATAYSAGDSVSYNSSSYVAIQSTTGNLPTDTTYWQLLAAQGVSGGTLPVDTDGTLAADSDSFIATQKATKTYVDALNVPLKAQYRTQRMPALVSDSVVTIFASGHGWTIQGTNGSTNSNLNDTSDFCLGSQCVSLVSDGAGTSATITLRSAAATGVDLTSDVFRIWVKVTGQANLNRLAFIAFSGSTSNSYTWTFDHGTDVYPLTQDSVWVPITLSFADATTTGSPSRTNITQYQFSFSDTGTPVTVKLNGVAYRADGSNIGPAICVTLDDGWNNPEAIAFLDSVGIRASFNIIAGTIGTTGYMTTDQLQQLHDDRGHEINCHAYTLANHNLNFVQLLAQQGQAALDAELANIKQWMTDNGFADGADLLALPNGAYNIDPSNGVSVMTEAKKFFSYVRTIYSHQGQYVETIPVCNPFAIRAISGISGFSGGISVANANAYIDKAVANSGLATLTFHRVVSGTPTSTNEISLTDFETIINHAIATGAPIRTLGDVMRSMDTSLTSKNYVDTRVATKPSAGSSLPLVASSSAPSAGVSTTAARSDHIHPRYDFQAADHGLISWAYDVSPINGSSTPLPTAGVLYVTKLHIPVAQTITNIVTFMAAAGSSLTSGQCFAALYQNGSLLGQTADQAAAWASTGLKTMALASPASAAAGDVYVAYWFNGTTGPAPYRTGGTSGFINLNLAATASRFGVAGSGITTTAPSTLPTVSAGSIAYWAAVS